MNASRWQSRRYSASQAGMADVDAMTEKTLAQAFRLDGGKRKSNPQWRFKEPVPYEAQPPVPHAVTPQKEPGLFRRIYNRLRDR